MKMHPWQKVNMSPGIQCITKKHNLSKNLKNMQKQFGAAFEFYPKTWVLPIETLDLRSHSSQNNNKAFYIVKPDSMAQGKGIFLSRSVDYILDVCSKTKANPNLECPDGEERGIGYIVQ